MAHASEELVRRGFDAFSKGDVDTLRELFDPDAVWHAPGRSRLSGDHRGVDDILDFFARTLELTAGTFRVELHDVSTSASKAVCISSRTVSRATSSKTSARGWSDANSSSISARARSVGDTRPATGVGPPSCSRRFEGTYARCAFTPGAGRHPSWQHLG
jgi:hypothetical protein